MIYGVYVVYDKKTGYLPPQVDINDASAVRNFTNACRRPDSLMFSNGSDYELYKIASYNTDNGVIEPIEKEFLVNGEDHA